MCVRVWGERAADAARTPPPPTHPFPQPSQAPDAAALATLLHCAERDARVLVPAPPGSPPAPCLLAPRGRSLLVGIEGVRVALSPTRALILAAPASPHGALETCAPPRLEAPLVQALTRAARAHGTGAAFLLHALDACLETLVESLWERVGAVALDAAAAADAILAGGASRAALTRLRAAKHALSDAVAASRRITAALRPRRSPRDDDVAASLAAAARRADGAAATVADAAAGLRGAEACTRMIARRRAWLLYC